MEEKETNKQKTEKTKKTNEIFYKWCPCPLAEDLVKKTK